MIDTNTESIVEKQGCAFMRTGGGSEARGRGYGATPPATAGIRKRARRKGAVQLCSCGV